MAYIRHRGNLDEMINTFREVYTWAERDKNLVHKRTQWLLLIHDNPATTSGDMLWHSAGILLDENIYNEITPESEVSKMILPKGKYLCGQFTLIEGDIRNAWDAVCVQMIDHNIQSGDGYHFERFQGPDPFSKTLQRIEIFVPIQNSP